MNKYIYIEAYTNPNDGANRQVANNIRQEVSKELTRLYSEKDMICDSEIYVMDSEGLLDGVALVIKKEILIGIFSFLIETNYFSDFSICEVESRKGGPDINPGQDIEDDSDDNADWWKG
jgi:hypothetical protein